jgi:hypothetical protein
MSVLLRERWGAARSLTIRQVRSAALSNPIDAEPLDAESDRAQPYLQRLIAVRDLPILICDPRPADLDLHCSSCTAQSTESDLRLTLHCQLVVTDRGCTPSDRERTDQLETIGFRHPAANRSTARCAQLTPMKATLYGLVEGVERGIVCAPSFARHRLT